MIKNTILVLTILSIGCGISRAQSGIIPTVFVPVLSNAPGTIPVETIAIAPQYMIGQYTHTLSLTLVGVGCGNNSLVVGLDGSFNNTVWTALGAPITILTGSPGSSNQLTGLTIVYGAFPFLRVNIRRAFAGLGCISNLNYVGSVTPVSFPTSPPQGGEQYVTSWFNGNTFLAPDAIATTLGLGGRLNIYGLSIHNQDATTASVFTLTLYNKGTGSCAIGTGTSEVLGAYRVAAGGTFQLSLSAVPIWSFPNVNSSGAATSFGSYDPLLGFYQVCISSSASVASSINMVSRTF
jgi:hypothetical protein